MPSHRNPQCNLQGDKFRYAAIWLAEGLSGSQNMKVSNSVVSVTNVSFERTDLSSERSEQDHFMDWFVPFSVQLSSAAIMPAGSGTAVTHSVSEREPRGWIINWMTDRLAAYQFRELESTERFGEQTFWTNHFTELILEIQFSKKNCRSHH